MIANEDFGIPEYVTTNLCEFHCIAMFTLKVKKSARSKKSWAPSHTSGLFFFNHKSLGVCISKETLPLRYKRLSSPF